MSDELDAACLRALEEGKREYAELRAETFQKVRRMQRLRCAILSLESNYGATAGSKPENDAETRLLSDFVRKMRAIEAADRLVVSPGTKED